MKRKKKQPVNQEKVRPDQFLFAHVASGQRNKGIERYGKPVEEAGLSEYQLAVHTLEELCDALAYMEAAAHRSQRFSSSFASVFSSVYVAASYLSLEIALNYKAEIAEFVEKNTRNET